MTKEKFLQLAADKFDKIDAAKDADNLLAYELQLQQAMRELSQELIAEQLGGSGQDRRKKKLSPRLSAK